MDSCLVEWRTLHGHSFPEVTNKLVMGFILAHSRLKQTRRDCMCVLCVCVCVCEIERERDSDPLTSGIQLTSWFRFGPTFSAFVLVLLSQFCAFWFSFTSHYCFSALICPFFFLFTLVPSSTLLVSFSLPPPMFLLPWAVCDAVWRNLKRLASECWTTVFNFYCLS